MMSRFILTANAARDIDEILEYVLQHDGPGPALHIHQRLYEEFSKIADQPGIGHVRDDLADVSLRAWCVFNYLIIYPPETKPLQIIRVIHGMRDLHRIFGPS